MNLENPSLKLKTEFACRSMTYHSGRIISHSLRKRFLRLLHFVSRKPPTYTIKDEHNEIIRGKFYHKELIKVILQWKRSQWSWFQRHLLNYLQTES